MPGKPHVPLELRRAPFSIAEARAAGVSGKALRGREWRRLGRELYCWRGWESDPWLLLAAWHRMNPSATFSGLTAAWMHGLAAYGRPLEVSALLLTACFSLASLLLARVGRGCQPLWHD